MKELKYAALTCNRKATVLAVKEINDMTGRLEKCVISVAPARYQTYYRQEGRTIKALRSLLHSGGK